LRDENGNPYGISPYVNQEMSNPRAFRYTQLGNTNWSDDFIANVFAEVKFLNHFTFKSSLNGKKAYWGSQNFTPLFYLSATYSNLLLNSLSRTTQKKFEWSFENTLNYQNKFGDHSLNVLLGTGYYDYNIGNGQTVTHKGLPISSYEEASFNFEVPLANQTSSAWDNQEWNKASYFGRLIYDFKNKYLFTGTLRYDGSSLFGANHHWGVFPSFSLGWNVDKENFWPENNVVNSLKFRGGYGTLGNDGIEAYKFSKFYISGANYTSGSGGVLIGYLQNGLENKDLKWETTTQTNIAADLRLFKNFTLTVDVYDKKTSDILRPVQIPGYVGVTGSYIANIGDMSNKGIEVELGYKKNWNDFTVSVNTNFAYNKNEVLSLEQGTKFLDGAGFQSMGSIQRIVVGDAYNSFYGFKTLGVFQNQAQIDAYVNSKGQLLQTEAKPGDFIWADSNGDGVINDLDKVNLGSSIPKYNYGATLNVSYKNWDFMVFGQGAGGNKIFQGLRSLRRLDSESP
jgi:TonB-linked SusC/RagA family outer membrane protein